MFKDYVRNSTNACASPYVYINIYVPDLRNLSQPLELLKRVDKRIVRIHMACPPKLPCLVDTQRGAPRATKHPILERPGTGIKRALCLLDAGSIA